MKRLLFLSEIELCGADSNRERRSNNRIGQKTTMIAAASSAQGPKDYTTAKNEQDAFDHSISAAPTGNSSSTSSRGHSSSSKEEITNLVIAASKEQKTTGIAVEKTDDNKNKSSSSPYTVETEEEVVETSSEPGEVEEEQEQVSTGSNGDSDSSSDSNSFEDEEKETRVFDNEEKQPRMEVTPDSTQQVKEEEQTPNADVDDDAVVVATPPPPESPQHRTSTDDLNETAITPKAGSLHHRKAISDDEGATIDAGVPDLTTNGSNSSSHHSLLPPPVTPNKSAAETLTSTKQTESTSITTTTTSRTAPPSSSSSICIPSHAAIKVIKGEIHNVLTMMRATDQRYVSRSRFTEELLPSEAGGSVGSNNNSSSSGGNNHTMSGYHPVAQALQDLHAQLTAAVEQGNENELLQNSHVYLEAFCQAIEGQDISAPVTGAALQALHKFVLYGFVVGGGNNNAGGGSRSGGMMRIAQALLECRFEESSSSPRSFVSALPPPSAGNEGHRRSIKRASSGPSSSSMAYAAAQAAAVYHHHTPTTTSIPYDDEQTVLKLLDVAALTVRTSLQEDTVHLMDATTIVRLLDACLHVSHRAEKASPLLKSAAASALSQIVLQVFAGPGHAPVMEARREILAKLASLLNPQSSRSTLQDAASEGAPASSSSRSAKAAAAEKQQEQQQARQVIVASSLTLVNIALETCREPLTADEIHILQNDLFKYLLQWSSTTHDLMLLSLTLRVIFNLFQSIRNHLKVPLEVFLTSVHLRILNDAGHNYSPEEKEVALESLLEFCQEPALMQDIFLNYDCDMACTNLYESIVTELGRAATPDWRDPNELYEDDGVLLSKEEHVHGGGEIVASPDGKGQLSHTAPKKASSSESLPAVLSHQAGSEEDAMPPVTHLQRLGVEGLLAVLDSIAKRCQEMRRSASNSTQSLENLVDANPAGNEQEDDGSVASFNNEFSSEITTQELHERKRRKHAHQKVARAFNAGPMNDSWKELAVREKILDSEASAKSIAEFLLTASHVDKAKLGIYLSKGPDEDYPFNAAVREAFVSCYDFKDLTFAAALRKFLSKFRLPGEAQCIDRLMESFSKELHRQRGEDMFFKNSDAIYVLAFSTIMLNTDLHNPTIKEEQRMTKEQFVRNNRGINGGDDLPAEFLEELYDQIKENEIQVRKELGEFMKKHEHEDFRTVWDNMLSKKGEVAMPFFTPTGLARSSSRVIAGFHDKEMFIVLSKSAVQAFSGIFLRSWDDALVVKALDALRSVARVAAYLGCDSTVTEVLQVLLPQGRDYVLGCIASGLHVADGASVVSNGPTVNSESLEEDESTHVYDAEQPIPYGLLCCNNSEQEVDITGSAAHRGLLALDCSFVLMRKYGTRVNGAWPLFVECLCVLRDCRSLPAGLSDLDDFADSNGIILPHTSFAKVSRKRLNDYYRSLSEEKDTQASKGWFRSFFRKKSDESDDIPDDVSVSEDVGELSAISRTLLAIAEAAGVENVVQLGLARLPDVATTIQTLLDRLDLYPYKGNPVGEQHAIFSLELSARALLSNKDRATELFTLFLDKFESVLGKVSPKKVPAPFVIERIVVTILRCCIHLYDIPEVCLSRYTCGIF